MIITVQFKDKNKIFKGKTYDYLLSKNEITPKKGSIIRMMDEEYNFLANGTRVKIVGIKENSSYKKEKLQTIKYIETTLGS